MKCKKIKKTTNDHGNLLLIIDAEVLRYRYQIGLETLVVYTMNYEYKIKIILVNA